MIRDTLGFGQVIPQGKRSHRYIVQDKKALELLVALFNGNLVLPTKQRNFQKFVDLYNQKAGKGRIILEKVKPLVLAHKCASTLPGPMCSLFEAAHMTSLVLRTSQAHPI